MKLRREQLDAFRPALLTSFEHRAIRHLRTKLPGPTRSFSDEELRARIRDVIPRAGAYGLTTERQIVCFLDLTFLLGERFDEDLEYRDVVDALYDLTMEPDERAVYALGIAYGRYWTKDGPPKADGDE